MRRLVSGMAFALGLLLVTSAPAGAERALGVWLTDGGKAKVRVSKCGKNLCSKIIWLRRPRDENGRKLRDYYNPNPKLRRRPIIGLPIMNGLKKTGHNQWAGHIYNPENGKTFQAYLTVVKPNLMVLKGCTMWGWPCGQKQWVRTRDPNPPAKSVVVAAKKAAPAARAAVKPEPAKRVAAKPVKSVTVPSPAPKAVESTATIPRRQVAAATQPRPRPVEPRRQPSPMTLATADAGFVVQVAARRSETGAREAFDRMKRRFPGILGLHEAFVQRADLGAKGIWYRLRIGPLSDRRAAARLCNRLRAAGGPACFVRLQKPRPGSG